VAKPADNLAERSERAASSETSSERPSHDPALSAPAPDGGASSASSPSGLAKGHSRVCPICDQTYPPDFQVCPRDAARLEDAEPSDDDPLVGTVLGQSYRISRAIGEGASAKVYEATHLRLATKRFAIKVLHSFYTSNPTVVARFQREAEAAATIEHAGVVGVYDMNRTEDGKFYIVTELLAGTDLGSMLKQEGRLKPGAAVGIVRQVCQALAAAHEKGIVHRDVKPGNVFISGPSDAPRVKVLDFGISKIRDGAGLTRTGVIVGTPAYMSPEQASGGKIDARTDVYAVGALLYRALTGKTPFDTDDASQLLSKLLSEEPERPRSIEPTIPEALELVIQRAMAKASDDRYASIADLDRALAPFAERSAAPRELSVEQAPAEELARIARDSRLARPLLVLLSVLGFVWAAACADAALLSVLAASDPPDSGPKLGRVLTVAGGTLVVLAGPFILWLRHVKRVWQSTPTAIGLSRSLSRTMLAALVTYAVIALAMRVAGLAAVGTASDLGPFMDAALGSSSLAAGAAVWLTSRKHRKAAS
jgi:serine/threonine protein kinase